MSNHAVKTEDANKAYDGLLAERLGEEQKMLVLRCRGEVFYIHCNILGMDVSDIPNIRLHALGYELSVSWYLHGTVRHYVRSVYAIAHGKDSSKWVCPEDGWEGQLLDVARLAGLMTFLHEIRSPYKHLIHEATADCARFIQNDLSLRWGDDLGDGDNAKRMDKVEGAWIDWGNVTADLPNDYPGTPDACIVRDALVRKVAQTCPLAIFQNLRDNINEFFEEEVLLEMKKLVDEALG